MYKGPVYLILDTIRRNTLHIYAVTSNMEEARVLSDTLDSLRGGASARILEVDPVHNKVGVISTDISPRTWAAALVEEVHFLFRVPPKTPNHPLKLQSLGAFSSKARAREWIKRLSTTLLRGGGGEPAYLHTGLRKLSLKLNEESIQTTTLHLAGEIEPFWKVDL